MILHIKGLRKIFRIGYKIFKTNSELKRMQCAEDIITRRIARAIESSLDDKLSEEENNWIREIEDLRKELISSKAPLLPMENAAILTGNTANEHIVTVGEVCRNASKQHEWGVLLFKLIRELKPDKCLELGTCLGISAAYQAAALKINRAGDLTTLEGAKSRVEVAEENFRKLGFDNVHVICGSFQDNLGRVLEEKQKIDFAFIDGHHDEKATIQYFYQILPYLSDNHAVLVFDDIGWSKGMRRAWKTISNSQEVKLNVDMFYMGICVVSQNSIARNSFRIAIY